MWGTLSVTNKRIIFSGKISFDKKILQLSAVKPYTDAIDMQFGSKMYEIATYDADYIIEILDRIINDSQSYQESTKLLEENTKLLEESTKLLEENTKLLTNSSMNKNE